MLARQTLLRCAQRPVIPTVRRYANQSTPPPPPPPSGEPSSASKTPFMRYFLIVAGATGLGAAAYSLLSDQKAVVKDAGLPLMSTFRGGEQGFVSLRLDSVETLNHNTKKFRFALPHSNDVSGLTVASAILTKYKGPEMSKPVLRPYTPVSSENEPGYMDLVVKKYPNGPMSTHMHDMVPGQQLDFKGPLPKYSWEPNKHESVAMIAGGTGITPMYQIIRNILGNKQDKTKITLVYGNLTEDDIILKQELEHYENQYPQRLRVFYLVDKPSEKWQQGTGHVTKELLKTVLPFEPKDGEAKGKIFVCGPPGLYKAVSGEKTSPKDQGELQGILKDLGYSKEQVYKF